MKKVTTNMTFGQILFIFFILLASSLMFFYFGAKFGGDILTLADRSVEEVSEPFLPDDKLSAEIQDIIANHDQKLVFHEAVAEKAPPALTPQPVAREDGKKGSVTVAAVAPAKTAGSASGDAVKKPAAIASGVQASSLPTLSDALRTAAASKPAPGQNGVKSTVATKGKVPDETAKKVLLPGSVPEANPVAAAPKPAAPVKTAAKPATPPEDKLRVLLPGADAPTPTQTAALPSMGNSPKGGGSTAPGMTGNGGFAPASRTYRLQVGSYARKNVALKARTEWEGRGYDVSLAESTIPGKGTWYRLYVGSYDSQAAAQGAQRQIMKSYRQTAMILAGE